MTQSPTTEDTTVAAISADTSRPEPTKGPGPIRRFARQLWRLIKFLLILAILAGIGLAIYYGWPIVNERYIQPIASNTSEIQTAAERLDSTDARISDLETQIENLQAADAGVPDRLAAIDSELGSLADAQSSIDGRLTAIDRQIDGHTNRIAELDSAQTALASDVETNNLEASLQVDLLRSMELLSRARLFLFQANYGLAEADMVVAESILAQVQATYPDWQPDVMTEVLFRVRRTVDALPLRPVVAANDLDIAWQVLLTQIAPGVAEDAPAEETPDA